MAILPISLLRMISRRGGPVPAGPRASRKSAAPSIDRLEERLVLSTVSAATPTAPLYQDASGAYQAFSTFNVSYQSAVTALRATATTTAAPTAAGITAFDAAVSTAIGTLNTTIASDLSNLPATGASLATTIDGYTATLQGNLESAGSGLANSTNAAVNALYRESRPFQASAFGQVDRAILSDTTTGSITPATLGTANKAVFAALTTFNSSIQSARASAVAAGTTLSSTAVSSAVATLQTSLTSAVAGLGTAFTSGAENPSAAITASLTSLTNSLTSLAAPTAGSRYSAYLFDVSVYLAEYQNAIAIQNAIYTGVSSYNHGLL